MINMDNQYMNIFLDTLKHIEKLKPIRDVPEFARKKEQPRNELCKCGSGLKYKKCCGK